MKFKKYLKLRRQRMAKEVDSLDNPHGQAHPTYTFALTQHPTISQQGGPMGERIPSGAGGV